MASCSLSIKRSAAKEIERIEPKKIRRAIIDRVRQLSADPRPTGSEKLSGGREQYRIRRGDWRIVYEIRDAELVVVVVKVGNRRDVYRRL